MGWCWAGLDRLDRFCAAKHPDSEKLLTKVAQCGVAQIKVLQGASNTFGSSRLLSLYMYSALSVLRCPQHVNSSHNSSSSHNWSGSALSGCRLEQVFHSRNGAEVNLPPMSQLTSFDLPLLKTQVSKPITPYIRPKTFASRGSQGRGYVNTDTILC